VSSIWTPGGEYRPEPEPPEPSERPGTGPGGVPADGPLEGELDEAQMREALGRLVATPVGAIVADHAVRLHELAVLHLGLVSERPESLGEAALAIDAMAALVESLGDRLGEGAQPLADALAQLRLAYVTVRGEAAAGPELHRPDA
jgi:hypothetical protein